MEDMLKEQIEDLKEQLQTVKERVSHAQEAYINALDDKQNVINKVMYHDLSLVAESYQLLLDYRGSARCVKPEVSSYKISGLHQSLDNYVARVTLPSGKGYETGLFNLYVIVDGKKVSGWSMFNLISEGIIDTRF